MPKILLIGRNGQVAWELQRTLACLGQVIVLDRTTQPVSIDLAKPETVRAAINAITPDLIVNAAAYTAVDKAEQESELAHTVNGLSVQVMAECAKTINAGLIHYSTDYVFDGAAQEPYLEDHPTDPRSVYGASKLFGERAITESGADYLILRTAWVYGGRGHNFLLTMLRLMRERKELSIVSDQYGSPTESRQIAEATAMILAKTVSQTGFTISDQPGIYHLTCQDHTTWHGFASSIYQRARELNILKHDVEILPIKTVDYPTPAPRPSYSVLAGGKLKQHFGLQMPPWKNSLEQCLADFVQ